MKMNVNIEKGKGGTICFEYDYVEDVLPTSNVNSSDGSFRSYERITGDYGDYITYELRRIFGDETSPLRCLIPHFKHNRTKKYVEFGKRGDSLERGWFRYYYPSGKWNVSTRPTTYNSKNFVSFIFDNMLSSNEKSFRLELLDFMNPSISNVMDDRSDSLESREDFECVN